MELRRFRGLGTRGRLDAENIDLLWLPRSAVVIALSSLDAYIHAVLLERIPIAMNQSNISESLAREFADLIAIKNASDFQRELQLFKLPHLLNEMSNRLYYKKLQYRSYQSPDNIISAYRLLGIDDIFQGVAEIWQGPNMTNDNIKRRLANYVNRRNQIAHEGDRETSGNVRAIQPIYADDCAAFVRNLVSRLDQLIYDSAR